MLSAFFTAASLLISFLAYKAFRWVQNRKKIHNLFNKMGIPGPKPSFLDGNFVELRATKNATGVLTSWYKKYGPIFGYYVGAEPYLVIHDLEMLKQVLQKDFADFTDRPQLFMESAPACSSIIADKGQKWKLVRSILTPTFSSRKIRLMSRIMNKKVAVAVDVVKKHADRGEDFDIYDVVKNLTLDVISECALAMKVQCQTQPNDSLKQAMQDAVDHSDNKVVELAVMFPVLLYFVDIAIKFTTFGKVTNMVVKNLEQVIKYRREHPEEKKVDLLQIMIDSADSDPDDPTSKKPLVRLTDAQLIANAFLFLAAGFETTSTALGFTFWLLVQHPEVQEKLYEEIMEHCRDNELSYECVQGMQYLEQVFSESLRLYPPVTTFISRVSQRECTIENITIPKGVTVLAPVWDIHRNPDVWPEPDEFDPERFAPENKSRIPSMAYFPFGAGPRYCIGTRFAQLEAKLALAHLVRQFKFVSCEKTESTLTIITPVININPAHGIYVKAIPRSDQ